MGRYFDPLTDWSFKRLFGGEPGKEILIEFLNDLFAGEKVITDLVYGPGEHNGIYRGDAARSAGFFPGAVNLLYIPGNQRPTTVAPHRHPGIPDG